MNGMIVGGGFAFGQCPRVTESGINPSRGKILGGHGNQTLFVISNTRNSWPYTIQ